MGDPETKIINGEELEKALAPRAMLRARPRRKPGLLRVMATARRLIAKIQENNKDKVIHKTKQINNVLVGCFVAQVVCVCLLILMLCPVILLRDQNYRKTKVK